VHIVNDKKVKFTKLRPKLVLAVVLDALYQLVCELLASEVVDPGFRVLSGESETKPLKEMGLAEAG
jgi:hypothetical protein